VRDDATRPDTDERDEIQAQLEISRTARLGVQTALSHHDVTTSPEARRIANRDAIAGLEVGVAANSRAIDLLKARTNTLGEAVLELSRTVHDEIAEFSRTLQDELARLERLVQS
jgi:hypothetical protein